MGKDDELFCRFCKHQLPPWIDALGDEGRQAVAEQEAATERRRKRRLYLLVGGFVAVVLLIGIGLVLFNVRIKNIK